MEQGEDEAVLWPQRGYFVMWMMHILMLGTGVLAYRAVKLTLYTERFFVLYRLDNPKPSVGYSCGFIHDAEQYCYH